MPKQLGVGQKSAEGIVLDRTRHCGEEGPNEERQGGAIRDLARQGGFADLEPLGGQSFAAATEKPALGQLGKPNRR